MDEKKKQGTLNGDTKNENGGHKNDELKNLIARYVAEAIKNEKATWEKDFSDRIVSEREDAAKMATMSFSAEHPLIFRINRFRLLSYILL